MYLLRILIFCIALCNGNGITAHQATLVGSFAPAPSTRPCHIAALHLHAQQQFRLIRESLAQQMACNPEELQLSAEILMQLSQNWPLMQLCKEEMSRLDCSQQLARKRAAAYQAELHRIEKHTQPPKTLPERHRKQRRKAIQLTQRNPSRTYRTFVVNESTKNFAAQYTVGALDYGILNDYERQLHTEFLEQLTLASQLGMQYRLLPQKSLFLDAVGYGIALGVTANHSGHAEIATRWADYGWQVLDIMQAIGEGCILGMQNSADSVLHPVDTVIGALQGVGMIVSFLVDATGTVVRAAISTDPQHKKQLSELIDNVEAVMTHCTHQLSQCSMRDAIKTVMAGGVEFFAPDTTCKIVHKLCANIKPILMTLKAARMRESLAKACQSVLAGATKLPAIQEPARVGKAVVAATEISVEVLKEFHGNFMRMIQQEIAILQSMFSKKAKGFAEFANKYIKIDYAHILGMELTFDSKGFSKLSGFHHDFMQTVESSGMMQFANKIINEHGFYKVDVIINGRKVEKTFFPSNWTHERVVATIYEAYESGITRGTYELLANGKYRIKGLTQEGVEVLMFVTLKGNITSAYPILT